MTLFINKYPVSTKELFRTPVIDVICDKSALKVVMAESYAFCITDLG